jgi:Right handed beta helix region
MKKYQLSKLFIYLLLTTVSTTAFSQATRTWVSGVGDDVNPASRTAPCKTFAGAISKTAAGGEINVLDPGGYGAVTITKSISIDGGGSFASILSSMTNGVIINAGPAGVVILRNLNINGAGNGLNGIRIISAKKVIIEDCNLFNFTQKGIEINTTDPCTVILNRVTIHNAEDAIGMSNAASTLVMDGCRFQSLNNAGINLGSGQAIVSSSNITDCGTGIIAAAKTTAWLSGNVISNNITGLQTTGSIISAGTNLMVGNKVQGTISSVIKLQ